MKRILIVTILLTLLLSACATQPTPAPTLAPTSTPVPPTATPLPPTPTSTEVAFEDLPYDQQKAVIESRFEVGSTAFEALIKDDGNLEYYDGTWKTLEAMRNLNGEIIPWGESYDLVSEEGRNGILNNIMAGNEEVMDEHIHYAFDNTKKNLEDEGYESSTYNMLYVQFYPDIETLARNNRVHFYTIEGQMIVKNSNSKIYVIDVKVCFGWIGVLHTYVKSENIFARRSTYLYDNNAFEKCFLGINPLVILLDFFPDDLMVLHEPEVKDYVETIKKSNLENFIEKLETSPASIGENTYFIHHIIYPTY